MTTNWPATLRRASYKGVAFQVEDNKPDDFGRHGVNHDFVNGTQGAAEDLGYKTGSYKLSAYIASDAAYADADALQAACTSPGFGPLILPTGAVILCLCTGCGRAENRDKLGYVGFDLDFMPQGGSLGPFGVDLFDRVAASALSLLPAALASGFLALVGPSATLIAIAATAAGQVVGVVQSFVAAAPLASADAATANAALAQLAIGAPNFAIIDDVAAWTQSAATAVQNIGSALDPQDAQGLTATLVASLGALIVASASPGIAAQNVLGNAVALSLQGVAAGEAARAAAALPLSDRASAQAALDALTTLTDPVADALGTALGGAAAQPLSDALLAAARQLSATMLDTSPLIEVSATMAYPASAMAFLLYADPSRADELLTRNEIGTPLFLPTLLEALAQ